MDKQQQINILTTINDTFSEYHLNKLNITEVEARMRALVPLINGWEACEAQQSPSDALSFAEWCSSQGWNFDSKKNNWWALTSLTTKMYATTEELYKLFNPSGETSGKIKCRCISKDDFMSCSRDCDYIEQRLARRKDPQIQQEKPHADKKPFDALRDRIDTEKEWEASMSPPAGPVWVKANVRIPKDDKPVHCKIDNDTKRMGNFYNDENGRLKFYVQGMADNFTINSDKFNRLEWLDESDQQLFTREQIEMAYRNAYHQSNIYAKASAAQQDLDEYMNTNYPTNK